MKKDAEITSASMPNVTTQLTRGRSNASSMTNVNIEEITKGKKREPSNKNDSAPVELTIFKTVESKGGESKVSKLQIKLGDTSPTGGSQYDMIRQFSPSISSKDLLGFDDIAFDQMLDPDLIFQGKQCTCPSYHYLEPTRNIKTQHCSICEKSFPFMDTMFSCSKCTHFLCQSCTRNEQESSISLESEQIIPETFLSQLSARELPEDAMWRNPCYKFISSRIYKVLNMGEKIYLASDAGLEVWSLPFDKPDKIYDCEKPVTVSLRCCGDVLFGGKSLFLVDSTNLDAEPRKVYTAPKNVRALKCAVTDDSCEYVILGAGKYARDVWKVNLQTWETHDVRYAAGSRVHDVGFHQCPVDCIELLMTLHVSEGCKIFEYESGELRINIKHPDMRIWSYMSRGMYDDKGYVYLGGMKYGRDHTVLLCDLGHGNVITEYEGFKEIVCYQGPYVFGLNQDGNLMRVEKETGLLVSLLNISENPPEEIYPMEESLSGYQVGVSQMKDRSLVQLYYFDLELHHRQYDCDPGFVMIPGNCGLTDKNGLTYQDSPFTCKFQCLVLKKERTFDIDEEISAFKQQGRYMFVGGKTIKQYDIHDNCRNDHSEPVQKFQMNDRVFGIGATDDLLAVSLESGWIFIYELDDPSGTPKYKLHDFKWHTQLEFLQTNGELKLYCNNQYAMSLWNIKKQRKEKEFHWNETAITGAMTDVHVIPPNKYNEYTHVIYCIPGVKLMAIQVDNWVKSELTEDDKFCMAVDSNNCHLVVGSRDGGLSFRYLSDFSVAYRYEFEKSIIAVKCASDKILIQTCQTLYVFMQDTFRSVEFQISYLTFSLSEAAFMRFLNQRCESVEFITKELSKPLMMRFIDHSQVELLEQMLLKNSYIAVTPGAILAATNVGNHAVMRTLFTALLATMECNNFQSFYLWTRNDITEEIFYAAANGFSNLVCHFLKKISLVKMPGEMHHLGKEESSLAMRMNTTLANPFPSTPISPHLSLHSDPSSRPKSTRTDSQMMILKPQLSQWENLKKEFWKKFWPDKMVDNSFAKAGSESEFGWHLFDDLPQNTRWTYKVVPLKNVGSIRFLKTLYALDNPRIFDNMVFDTVISIWWQKLEPQFWQMASSYVVFLILNVFFVLCMEQKEEKGLSELVKTSEGQFSVCALFFLFPISWFLGYLEYRQFTGNWAGYLLNDNWNYIDMGSIILSNIVYILYLARSTDAVLFLASFFVLLLFMNILHFARGFKSTAVLTRILISIVSDMYWFVMLLLAIVFTFAVIFRMLLGAEVEDFNTLEKAFLHTFTMSLVGELELSILDSGPFPRLNRMYYYLMVIIVMIVMLNALIAWMNNSFLRVQELSLAEIQRERVGLILELSEMLNLQDFEENIQWIHIAKPVGSKMVFQDQEWKAESTFAEEVKRRNSLSNSASLTHEIVKSVEGRFTKVQNQLEGVLSKLTENYSEEMEETST